MNDKRKSIIYALAGVYIAYLGISLIKSSIVQRPDNYIFFVCAGIVFLVFGGAILFLYLKPHFQQKKLRDEVESEEGIDDVAEVPLTAQEQAIETDEETDLSENGLGRENTRKKDLGIVELSIEPDIEDIEPELREIEPEGNTKE